MSIKSIISILVLCWSATIFADLVDDIKLSDPKNQEKIRSRHKGLDSIQELDSFIKEVDRLEQLDKIELVIGPNGKQEWLTLTASAIRDITINNTGLRDKGAIDKIRNRYLGNPDSEFTRSSVIAELLDYLANVGYPHAQAQLSVKKSLRFIDYDVQVFLESPCLITKISSTLQFPPGVEFNLKRGDICNLEHIHEELEAFERNLLAEGYQNSVIEIKQLQYSPTYSTLHLILGGTIGKRVSFEFIDESHIFLSNALDDDTLVYLRKNFSDPRQAKLQAIEYFKNKGYEFVQIRGPFRQIDDDGFTTYVFYVNPGDKYQITDLSMDGNKSISTEELKDAVISNLYELFSFSENKTFEEMKSDIITYYQSKGFWEAKIIRAYLEFLPKTKLAIMHVSINEGKEHKLKTVTVRGNKNLSIKDVLSLISAKPGDPIRQDDLSQLEYKIREKYFDNGYIEARVELSIHSEIDVDETINTEVIVAINEGPLIHIGVIAIKGLVKTNARVVMRELLFKQGDVYNQNLINQSRTALLNLGIFSAVTVERTDWISPETHELDLTIQLREGDAGRVKFGPGYNFVRGLQYAGEVSYGNLGGTGRRISLRGSISEERQQQSIASGLDTSGETLFGRKIGLTYTEPYIFGWPWNGSASINHQAIADDIWKISNTLELSMTHTFRPNYFGTSSIAPFYRYQLLENDGTPDDADSLTTTGRSRIGSIGVRYRLDSRNNLSFPTKGFILNTDVSWARYEFLGEFRYFQWHVSDSLYIGITKNLVLALGFDLAAYENVRRENAGTETIDVLPANQRLLAGGSNDVRGFDQELGPYVLVATLNKNGSIASYYDEDPLGGTNLFIFKAEIRQQITPDLFAVSLFWDTGNSFFTADELSKFNQRFQATNTPAATRSVQDNFNYDFADLLSHPDYLLIKNYQAAGFAVSLLTPLGALNASVGWPIKEPQSLNCKINNICYERAKDTPLWIKKYQLNFNVGAEF